MRFLTILLALLAMAALPALAGTTPAPPDSHLYIGWPNDHEVVKSPFHLWMGLRGMGVAPKGVDLPNTGHHHLIIDEPLPPMDRPIPADRHHLHFGAGETEADIDLPPGKHTLQLLMGDKDHIPHNPPVVSRKITITVR
jgi:hypothetical protein